MIEIVIGIVILGIIVIFIAAMSIKIVRQTDRAVIERFGKFYRYAEPGMHLIVPLVDKMYGQNITEQMVDVAKQEVITKDNLNCSVDAQIYYKVKPTAEDVYKSFYSVNNFEYQIVNLARTTLRDVIGNMSLKDANSKRNTINSMLHSTLEKEASMWGVEVVRAELKEIVPPSSVQETMNQVVIAENEKVAAADFALATETKADGEKKASIKRAEGLKQSKILEAEGLAEAIKLEANAKAEQIKVVNESAEKYFKDNAQVLKKLETIENSFKNNSKMIIPTNQPLVNLIDSLAGK